MNLQYEISMKKAGILSIFLLCLFTNISSKNIPFRLVIPERAITSNSIYNKIEFIDDRNIHDPAHMFIDAWSFSSQLNSLIEKITDRTSHNGILLFQLRNLRIIEKNSKEEAQIRLTLYERINDSYFLINTLNTSVTIESEELRSEIISNTIIDFVTSHLLKNYTDNRPYSIEDVHNVGFFEKEHLKAYNTTSLTDGIYVTHKDFIDQTPDSRKITPKFKNDELKEIKIEGTDSKLKKISPELIFAVVIDGQAYLSYKKKFVTLYKDNDEFCFGAKVNRNRIGIAPSFSVGIGSGGYRGGGIGIGILTHNQKENVIFMIDHLNGDIIPLSD